jgi:DNA-binding LacI/PurR family transcriptional regulator/anti-anti-sigma regulatory factor
MENDKKPKPSTNAEPHDMRLTIGLVTTGTEESWEQLPWQGAEDAAREQDANLITFAGGVLQAAWDSYTRANIVYALMSPECVAGFVIGTGAFDAVVGPEGAQGFCDLHRPLAAVSAERAIPGVSGVLLDDYHSMREALTHLIDVHGCRRIAYLGATSSAHMGFQERYRAYAETLREYDLPLDPNMVGFTEDDVELANWLRERVSDLDALTGCEDAHVLRGLRALQALGVRIPGDVAVVGFNDLTESRVTTPPLTTVRAPFYEMAHAATGMLLALLAGEDVPEQDVVTGELIVRQSCGCLDPLITQAAAGPVKGTDETLELALAARRESILSEMVQAMRIRVVDLDPEWGAELLDSFSAEMAGRSTGAFLSILDEVLRRTATAGSDVSAWHGAISALRRYVVACLDGESLSRAEDLWQQARVMIGRMAQRVEAYQKVQAEQQAQVLREVGAALITTFDMGQLMDVLAEGLPRLGIPCAYLSLYEDPQPYKYPQPAPEWSRLMLAYDEKGRVDLEAGGRRFPSRQLLPQGLWPQGRRYSFLVEPLYFRENQLGFALFEVGPRDGTVYEVLRGQISNALYGTLLLQEREQAEKALQRAYAQVEQQVEERTAELRRQIAERERAQEENLRLQQEIIEAQKHALQELSTPIIPVTEGVIVVPLIGSVDSMRARDITRRLLAGISTHRAKSVILDITGVPLVDSGVADHLNRTIQAARLKGARTIITGISGAVAETIVDLGIDWSDIDTLPDLQTGLRRALAENRS